MAGGGWLRCPLSRRPPWDVAAAGCSCCVARSRRCAARGSSRLLRCSSSSPRRFRPLRCEVWDAKPMSRRKPGSGRELGGSIRDPVVSPGADSAGVAFRRAERCPSGRVGQRRALSGPPPRKREHRNSLSLKRSDKPRRARLNPPRSAVGAQDSHCRPASGEVGATSDICSEDKSATKLLWFTFSLDPRFGLHFS